MLIALCHCRDKAGDRKPRRELGEGGGGAIPNAALSPLVTLSALRYSYRIHFVVSLIVDGKVTRQG